jgi:prevent-host-death family protein
MFVAESNNVSAFDAKTHLSQLLTKVQNGSRITITKHNTPVAMLVPLDSYNNRHTEDVISDIHALRKRLHLGKDIAIEGLKTEGRR